MLEITASRFKTGTKQFHGLNDWSGYLRRMQTKVKVENGWIEFLEWLSYHVERKRKPTNQTEDRRERRNK